MLKYLLTIGIYPYKLAAMTREQKILLLGKCYAQAKNLTLTSVGVYACNYGGFFKSLTNGASARQDTERKIIRWFSENWPADLAWPNDIERPTLEKKE